jgi:hypothetical protein
MAEMPITHGKRPLIQLKRREKWAVIFQVMKIKYGLLTTGFLPLVYFVGAYFLSKAFLDGKKDFI